MSETGDDTGKIDTGKIDTGTPEVPLSCPAPLATGFECKAPTDHPGRTTCTDEGIDAVVSGCFGSAATSTTCNAAKAKYAACYKCTIDEWTPGGYTDRGLCAQKIDPTGKCGKAFRCVTDCIASVCTTDDCDTTPGSGRTPSTSQYENCVSDVQNKGGTARPKGACYDIASKDAQECAGDPKFANCIDVTYLFRGACRDNGDWSKADIAKPTPTDAGTDAPTDSASDSAASDGAASDGASDAASDAAADGG
ncbi:MAG: hypothetical protein IPJ34_11345 [Myxococcales bacterium]|nr:hypothetical protein [Myxococcales bacterium]